MRQTELLQQRYRQELSEKDAEMLTLKNHIFKLETLHSKYPCLFTETAGRTQPRREDVEHPPDSLRTEVLIEEPRGSLPAEACEQLDRDCQREGVGAGEPEDHQPGAASAPEQLIYICLGNSVFMSGLAACLPKEETPYRTMNPARQHSSAQP